MKVLGIVCSPRKGGNTEILVNEALASAKELGAEVELVTIVGKNIAPCDGCASCKNTGECKIKDDMQEIYTKLLETDGVIFGTPVYYWNVTAQAKAIMDRIYVFREKQELKSKAGGVVTVARRAGATHAFSAFINFFNSNRMVIAGGAIAYADEKGEVRQDKRGMGEAKGLGKAMVKAILIHKEDDRQ